MKTFVGVIFFVMDLGALIFGALLTLIGIGLLGEGTGEGSIKIIVDNIGQLVGVNGQLVVLLAGVSIVLASLGYASKAFVEATRYESGPRDTIRHFHPKL